MTAFTAQRAAALSLLTNPTARLSRKAGSFLGQLAVDPQPMTDRQREWLDSLLERSGLPAFADGGDDDLS
jgi:hypothetical protein